MELKNIQDLFTKAGGAIKIAAFLGIHQMSVDRWQKIGISQKWWEKLIKEYDVTPAELYVISKKAKKATQR